MSAIAGVVWFIDPPEKSTLIEMMVDRMPHRGPEGIHTWSRGRVGLGYCHASSTPESRFESQPLSSRNGGLVLVADARIDNRQELIEHLSSELASPTSTRPLTDSELILAGYEKWGEHAANRLHGDFAFALWDEDRRQMYCARDPIGVRSLYYTHCREGFAFATEIEALFALPWVRSEVDEVRIADHIALDFDDVEMTFYRDIRRHPSAHWSTVQLSRFHRVRYWEPESVPILRMRDDSEYEEAFRDLFLTSVASRLRSHLPVGSTLSGGLDSSSICCAAREIGRQVNGEPLRTYSLVFTGLSAADQRRIDERNYAEAVLAGGGFDGSFLNGSQLSPLNDLEWICEHIAGPSVPFNLYLHLAMYRQANADGVRVLLDGFDGDTTLSYGYGMFAELAASGRWGTLLREARSFAGRVPNRSFTTWRVLRDYAIRPLTPAMVRRAARSLRLLRNRPDVSPPLLASEFGRRIGMGQATERHQSASPDSYRSTREEHLLALQSPLIPWSLEIADQVSGRFNLDLRFPFFDRRLMEFCLSLPGEQKLRDGWTRWILRRSMEGLLPPQVQWRRDKADLAPNFHSGMHAAGGQVLRGLLAQQDQRTWNYVNKQVIEQELATYLEEGGEQRAMNLFSVVALGLWLRDGA